MRGPPLPSLSPYPQCTGLVFQATPFFFAFSKEHTYFPRPGILVSLSLPSFPSAVPTSLLVLLYPKTNSSLNLSFSSSFCSLYVSNMRNLSWLSLRCFKRFFPSANAKPKTSKLLTAFWQNKYFSHSQPNPACLESCCSFLLHCFSA